MRGLLIDTSREYALLALLQEEKAIQWNAILHSNELSKKLLPAIDSLILQKNLDFLAVGRGPGSYTGTRIGAAVAKTLSFAWGLPLIGFASPLAYAPDARVTLPLFLQEEWRLKNYTLKGELNLTY